MHILIVEDDPALGLFLKKGLALEGHDVDWVAGADAALAYADAHAADLVVLDLSLGERDGTAVLRTLAERHAGTPVVVLTASSKVEERVRCLDMGADDCLVKPFSFQELTARCRALLRRRSRSTTAFLFHDDLALNRMERSLTKAGGRVDLTAKEFALLEFLLMKKGWCCSRAELLETVFGMPRDASTNVVEVYITYVRKKLGPAGSGSRGYIETVRGQGYRIGVAGRPGPTTVGAGEQAEALA